MLNWGAPFWLCGLALLPLIRWLHRGGRHRRVVPVSRLELWHGSAATLSATGKRQPPDPAWRRRALLAALLFGALAEPQWPERHPNITLWVDDSISMLTREPQKTASAIAAPTGPDTAVPDSADTRLVLSLAQARMQLDTVAHGQVAVRSLSDPWKDMGPLTDAVVVKLTGGAGQSEPMTPPAGLLRASSLHWLVTDGADTKLLSWPGNRQPDRIIQYANVTRNVGLERLSARRNPLQTENFDLSVKLTNGGTATEARELIVATEAGELHRSAHRLEPGASAIATLSVPASRIARATLEPDDALTADDSIALDLASLRKLRIATDPRCPAAVLSAVATHPGLAVAPYQASDVMAVLDCGSRTAAQGVPTLRVVASHPPKPVTGLLQWSSATPGSHRILLDASRLRTAARLQAGAGDAVLLAAGDVPLIILRGSSSKLIETPLDFGYMSEDAGPEIPLLLNLMFEELVGMQLLNRIAMEDRGPDAARVAPPAGIESSVSPTATGTASILIDGARPIVVAAVLMLLWEVIALARQTMRLREQPTGRTA